MSGVSLVTLRDQIKEVRAKAWEHTGRMPEILLMNSWTRDMLCDELNQLNPKIQVAQLKFTNYRGLKIELDESIQNSGFILRIPGVEQRETVELR